MTRFMPLSGDPPRSKVLGVALVVIVLALAFAPFLFPGAKPLNVAAKICIYTNESVVFEELG